MWGSSVADAGLLNSGCGVVEIGDCSDIKVAVVELPLGVGVALRGGDLHKG